jgi:hypothetical protein
MTSGEHREARRRMLIAAGYDFHPAEDLWINALLDERTGLGPREGKGPSETHKPVTLPLVPHL